MNDIDLSTDGWFRAAIGALWFCGACYALIGVGFGAMFLLPLAAAPAGSSEIALLVVFALMMLVVGVACAVGNIVVAQGLAKRKKWAWIAGVIVGGIYAPSGCLPFGLVILYALLRGGVKDRYDAEANEAAY